MPINCVHGFLEDALLCSCKIPKKTQSNLINLKINIVARGKKSNDDYKTDFFRFIHIRMLSYSYIEKIKIDLNNKICTFFLTSDVS